MKKIYMLFVTMMTVGLTYGQLPGVPVDDGTPAENQIITTYPAAPVPDAPTAAPDYYNYDTDGNGANSFPWNIAAGKEVQILFLAGEFNQPAPAPAGTITALAFRIRSNYPLGPWTYTDLTIKLGQSNITTLPSGVFYTGALTTVYYSASVSLTGAAGDWMYITLDTPFAYDPTQSLIVDVGQCGVPGATGFSSCYTNTPGSNRRNYSAGGCPFTYGGVSTYVYHLGFTLSTVQPPTVVTTAASSITATGATLNGTVNANGGSTTVTFDYGLTTGYGSTVTATQSPVTGNTVTPVSAPVTGLQPNMLYHFRVVGVNSAGTSNGNDMTFTTVAAPPIVVTEDAAPIGLTTATLNGTVTAQNSSTTVTFQWGLTPAFGNVANATPGTVTGNTATAVSADLTGLTATTTYYYRCVGVNSAGTTYGATLSFVAGCPQIPPAGPITGPTSVCANSTGNVYSITALPNTTGYVWSVPAGATITAGSNTTSITVTFGSTSGDVSVYGTSTCANGAPNSTAVTVNPIPTPTITGPNNMCVNSGTYAYTTEAGFTDYTWSISAGGTITQGTGTNQILVAWNASGAQWVGINYSTLQGCWGIVPTILDVTVDPFPDPAGSITGTAEVCNGTQGVPYSVAAIPNATYYVWNLPPGASIASGTGTNSITVDFAPDASSGIITVYGNNICGNGSESPDFPVTILTIPDDAGTITGPGSVCAGSVGEAFSVPPISGATGYDWTLPTGATIASGANTANITVDFAVDAVSGSITVAGTNPCGTGQVSPDFNVTVIPKPDAPVITIDGFLLSSNYVEGNQWFYNGAQITGATNQTLYAEYTGRYWATVTVDGCESDTSNNIYVVITGIDESVNSQFFIYPVPNDGMFTVACAWIADETLTLEVYNYLGVRIHESKVKPIQGKTEKIIDLRPVPNGVYTVVLRTEDNRVIRRILVNK